MYQYPAQTSHSTKKSNTNYFVFKGQVSGIIWTASAKEMNLRQ